MSATAGAGLPVTLDSAVASAEGRSVRVTFTGTVATGPCADTYTAGVQETEAQAVITVRQTTPPHSDHRLCPMIAEVRALVVPLPEPLDGRSVVDGATGDPAPRGSLLRLPAPPSPAGSSDTTALGGV